MAYEIEGRNHCDTHRILTATSLELKKTLLDLEEREEVMKNNPGHASQTMQRETIDSRDSFMVALHKVLGNPNHHQQLFLTYSSLQDAANNIEDEVLAARTSVATISTAKDQRMADLERQLKIYEKVLYSGSSTSKGLPQLSSPQLVDMMTRLEAMLSRLETTIRDTITDVEQKKKILKSDPLQIKGRNLFVFFMNDFAMLQQAMVEIETRWEANRVSTERQ
ncbi:HAUS augmin-like complex subunit 3 [Lineus longissimus]|uniref:HAUS augmin-like complex subunit 3 n=1 Tax=Lineus longissimus TaxID=88925 RepID=UPI00315CA2D8